MLVSLSLYVSTSVYVCLLADTASSYLSCMFLSVNTHTCSIFNRYKSTSLYIMSGVGGLHPHMKYGALFPQ